MSTATQNQIRDQIDRDHVDAKLTDLDNLLGPGTLGGDIIENLASSLTSFRACSTD